MMDATFVLVLCVVLGFILGICFVLGVQEYFEVRKLQRETEDRLHHARVVNDKRRQ
jgi:hypothetical protein